LLRIREAIVEAGAELTTREALDDLEGVLEDLARREEGKVNGYDRYRDIDNIDTDY
jgi:hypothetical protein